jgi:hypothetical protein
MPDGTIILEKKPGKNGGDRPCSKGVPGRKPAAQDSSVIVFIFKNAISLYAGRKAF